MRRRSLFTQVLVVNTVLLGAVAIVAGAVAGLAAGEVIVLAALAVLAGATVNMILLRRRFAPLEDLIQEMEKVDLSRPGSLLPDSIDGVGETEEVERLVALTEPFRGNPLSVRANIHNQAESL